MKLNTKSQGMKLEGAGSDVDNPAEKRYDAVPPAPKLRQHIGALVYNQIVTYIPSQFLRRATLRFFGAKFGRRSNILRGCTVFEPGRLSVGDECSIGFRCLLDARGWLTIGNRVVIASDTQFLAGYHDFRSPTFDPVARRIFVEDYVWIASRCTIESGLTIGRGAVVLTCTLVHRTIAPLKIFGGNPARVIGTRPDEMSYNPAWRPWGF